MYCTGSSLETLQETQVATLEVVGEKLAPLLETLGNKQADEQIRDQIEDKQEEVTELIATQQEAILEATSVEAVREIMEETKDRIILKTYDGITARESLHETIQVEGGVVEQQHAVDAVLEVIWQDQSRALQIVTQKTKEDVETFLRTFDNKVKVEELFRDGKDLYMTVTFDEESMLKQELFAGLDEGVLPEYFLGYKIVPPEVYTIGQISLSGEQLASLRGQMRRATPSYHSSLQNLPKIRVGVVDTWVDPSHPDLIHAISTSIAGYDFVNNDTDPMDDHMHGTHVAWTIAAAVNGWGVFGVHPYVEIVPLKICTKTWYCPSYAITNALVYAADQWVEVLNMSLWWPWALLNNPTCAAIEYATNKWSLAIVAAGNANTSATTFIPAVCPHTITVGAVNQSLHRASFSNYGPHVTISAPGVGIYSTIPWWWRKSLDGTSMATPHVSAAVAALLGKKWPMNMAMMKQQLLWYTLPVTYEPGKLIWPFLNYPVLMESVGMTGAVCSWTWCVNFFATWTTTSGDTAQIQYAQEFTSSHTGVVVVAGKTQLIHISHGTPPYRLQKSSDHIWFAYKDTARPAWLQIASAADAVFDFAWEEENQEEPPFVEDLQPDEESDDAWLRDSLDLQNDEEVRIASAQEFSFRVLGLKPGETMLTVVDAVGKKIEIPVRVEEQLVYLKYYGYLRFSNNDVYTFTNVASAKLAEVGRQTSPKLQASGKTSAWTIIYNIYNTHEKKSYKLHLSVLVGTTGDLAEYNAIQQGIEPDPHPMAVDKSHLEVYVGQEASVTMTWGRPHYMAEKWTWSNIGLGNIKEWVIQWTGLRIMWLRAWIASITVRDSFGRKQIVTVQVKERTYWLKPGWSLSVWGTNSRRQTKNVISWLGTPKYSSNSVWKISAGYQEGVSTITERIFNSAEQEEQDLIYAFRVGWTQAVEPLATNVDEINLQVGQVVILQIKGGIPKYTIKKSVPHVWFAAYKSSWTMHIASADAPPTADDEEQIIFESSDEEEIWDDEQVFEPQLMKDSEEEEDLSALHITPEIVEDIEIASSQDVFKIYVIGLTPGESTITITDHEWTIKTVRVVVKETTLTWTLGTEKGRYYLEPNRLYEVRGISTTHPALVSTSYRSNTYIYKMIADGITSLTLQLWNPMENKKQEMRYTVRSGSPSTMSLMINSGSIAVGEVALVTIAWGWGPYTITKNNEHAGLGYADSDMSSIASLPPEEKIMLPDGNQSSPVDAWTWWVDESGAYTTWWSDEDRAVFDALDADAVALQIASSTTWKNSQTFRVVGLSPGETTLTVKDVYGEVKTIPVTVEPKHLSFTSAYLWGYFRAPYNPKHLMWFMNSKPLASTSKSRWSVLDVRSSTPNVVNHFQRGHYRPYYLLGVANGSTDLMVDIYNPHERKNQTLTYQATTTGMDYADLVTLLAKHERDRQLNSGPASSINPGGWGFPAPTEETNSSSPTIQIVKEEDTILGRVVQIRIVWWSGKYQLTLDKSVHFVDSSLQIATFDTVEEEILWEELPVFVDEELIVEEVEEWVEVNAVIISQTYTVAAEANRTYSLILNNSSLLTARDIQKNTTATKQLTTNNVHSSYTYTALKWTSIDLPVSSSYLLASENNTIMSIVKKTTGWYRLSFPNTWNTKLKITYTNGITWRKTEVKIDIKVVEKWAVTSPVSSWPEVIEKTIYLDPTKEYALFLEDGMRYEIEHNWLLWFYTPSEYMYAMNWQWVGLAFWW
jgi:hypothetical protein